MENNGTTISGDGITFTDSITSTGTFIINTGGEITIDSFEFKETSDGNFIEIIKRQKPNTDFTYTFNWGVEQKDRVWKEIYGVTTNGTGARDLQLLQTIEAKVTPAHHVDEKIEFE